MIADEKAETAGSQIQGDEKAKCAVDVSIKKATGNFDRLRNTSTLLGKGALDSPMPW